jgi:hypothetical protein
MSSLNGLVKTTNLSFSDWSRIGAAGALSGAVAGALLGLVAFVIQTLITRNDAAKYGSVAVDFGAPFLTPGAILSVGLLGGFLGLLYAGLRIREPALARWQGLVFASLLAVGLQPLLLGRLYISAVVTVTTSGVLPGGFVKSGEYILDLLPMALEVGIMAGLVFLIGLLMHQLLRLASRLVPRLPLAVSLLVAGAIGAPGLLIFGVLLLDALEAIGGE